MNGAAQQPDGTSCRGLTLEVTEYYRRGNTHVWKVRSPDGMVLASGCARKAKAEEEALHWVASLSEAALAALLALQGEAAPAAPAPVAVGENWGGPPGAPVAYCVRNDYYGGQYWTGSGWSDEHRHALRLPTCEDACACAEQIGGEIQEAHARPLYY